MRQVDTLLVVAPPNDQTIFERWTLARLAPRRDVRVVPDGNHDERGPKVQPALPRIQERQEVAESSSKLLRGADMRHEPLAPKWAPLSL